MSVAIRVGMGEIHTGGYVGDVIQVTLNTSSKEIELYLSDIDSVGPNEFLDELGKAVNEAIIWNKEFMGIPEIHVDDSVKDYAEEVQEGLALKVARLLKDSEIV